MPFFHFLEVQREYLVYDMNGLIGSVGGTLGLFVGFSFFDLILKLFKTIKIVQMSICCDDY